ncbi:putative calcineurin-like phosphoesterase [Aeromonas phage LAh_6]|uniref:Putative calcineurin-like phosphoesterase n=1 Tax=Aeromonas phage LAh_6 TaxID=2591030 RepID=A0A513ZZW3_9CAUD|nr:phosphoesterase [Aeromonas phage LAh_6]QDH46535.1 putative calcineurin-like phosphoesterase [Aeromonas phage LAh_6]
MSRVMVSSDLHLGHRNVTKWRSQFSSVEEHDEYIIDRHIKTLGKRDIWVCLGDVCFDRNKLHRLNSISCEKKVLILGNHCTEHLSVLDFLEVFDEIHSLKKGSHNGVKYWLSHAPIHEEELRGKINIHGHMHERVLKGGRYINACLEHTEYEPVWIQDLLISGGFLDNKGNKR